MKPHLFTVALVAAALAAGTATGFSADPIKTTADAGKPMKLDSRDKSFVKDAAIGGMFEVKAGEMAQQKGMSAEVKDLGAMMVKDHTKANEELMAIASTKGMTLPTEIEGKHKATLDKLTKLTGAEFDKAYIAEMNKDHKKDVEAFEEASKSLKDPELKAFAEKTLPVLKAHHEKVMAHKSSSKGS